MNCDLKFISQLFYSIPYLINYLILGFVQGVTEFFPISSSGHLVLFQDFLGIDNAGASAEIIAHFGTLFSIILFYRATFFSNKNSDDFVAPQCHMCNTDAIVGGPLVKTYAKPLTMKKWTNNKAAFKRSLYGPNNFCHTLCGL